MAAWGTHAKRLLLLLSQTVVIRCCYAAVTLRACVSCRLLIATRGAFSDNNILAKEVSSAPHRRALARPGSSSDGVVRCDCASSSSRRAVLASLAAQLLPWSPWSTSAICPILPASTSYWPPLHGRGGRPWHGRGGPRHLAMLGLFPASPSSSRSSASKSSSKSVAELLEVRADSKSEKVYRMGRNSVCLHAWWCVPEPDVLRAVACPRRAREHAPAKGAENHVLHGGLPPCISIVSQIALAKAISRHAPRWKAWACTVGVRRRRRRPAWKSPQA